MIISRTPFRVSLAGGGSDFAEYYRQRPGNVVTAAINRYMYVTVNRRFDDTVRVSYTRTEIAERADDLQHDLIREAMKLTGLTRGLEITTIADLPAGIGLGSSSTLTVGVLNALYAMKGEWRTPADLARQACEIEIDILGKPIGKQDQYIAAFGGLQDIRFMPDGSVTVHPVICGDGSRERLVERLMLFYTGVHRDAGDVLREVRQRLQAAAGNRDVVDGLVGLAGRVREAIVSGEVERIGGLLDESWRLKKRMASNVSNGHFDAIYDAARRAGADGGKISGAGAGGCLLLFAPPRRQAAVCAAMTASGLREVSFAIEPEGSRIIHFSDDGHSPARRRVRSPAKADGVGQGRGRR
jgi:D-glycero-alpha-D-manno-heptose-7-phosphate kinase